MRVLPVLALLSILPAPASALDGGTPASTDDPRAAATVAIQVVEPLNDGTHRSHECSGALIAPDLVLTAGHCLDKAARPEHIAVFFFDGPRAVAPYAKVAAFTAHPAHEKGWADEPGDIQTRQTQVASDIAVLRLAAPVRGRRPVSFDAAARTMSFIALAAGSDRAGKSGTLRRTALGKLYRTQTGTPLVFASPEGAVCSGDSGGPVFTANGGLWGILGAITRAENGCSARAVIVPVDAAHPAFAGMILVARGR